MAGVPTEMTLLHDLERF